MEEFTLFLKSCEDEYFYLGQFFIKVLDLEKLNYLQAQKSVDEVWTEFI